MWSTLYPAPNWDAMRHDWPCSAYSVFVRCGDMRWHVQRMGQGPALMLQLLMLMLLIHLHDNVHHRVSPVPPGGLAATAKALANADPMLV